jgi:hypothetical protein
MGGQGGSCSPRGCRDGFYKGLICRGFFCFRTTIIDMADEAIFALIKANMAIAIEATDEVVAKAKADVEKWEVSV